MGRIRKCAAGVLLAAGLLSGCGQEQPAQVEITVIHGWGSTEEDHVAMRNIYSGFEEQNPDIKLRLLSMPTNSDMIRKVEDMIMVGEIPDVIFLGGQGRDSIYRFMVQNDLALDLMPYIRNDEELKNSVSPNNLNYWTTDDGELYTVSDVLLLSGGYWYNEDIFRQAGVTEIPQTFEEFGEACRKIRLWAQEEDNGVEPLQIPAEGYLYFADYMMVAEGESCADAIGRNEILIEERQMSNTLKQLQDIYAVGLNYTQNQVDGQIYTVHDQLESRGMWYNTAVLADVGVKLEDIKSWDDFGAAMDKVNALGGDSYGYIAGQGSLFMMNAMMASTENGKALLSSEMTVDTINSAEFADAFKAAAALDQKNGSGHTTENIGNLMDDFNKKGTVGALFNGVWNASGIDASLTDAIQPSLFPGNTAIASAGGGISISSGMDEAKTALALEFLAYMVSPEVQERIFVGVQAAPCNKTVDLQALAQGTEGDNAIIVKLAEACSQVNGADNVVINLSYTWGGDVGNAIINAFMECAVSGTDIDARFEQLKQELTALIA